MSITKAGAFYVNKERITKSALAGALRKALAQESDPTLILRAEQGVPIEQAVFVMDLANQNGYKVVLAVTPN